MIIKYQVNTHYLVDELFEGEKAFLAKERAPGIATVMQIKVAQFG